MSRSKNFGLGRKASLDLRDHNFLAATMLPRRLANVTSKTWRTGPILDQGATPQCVAYASVQFLHTSPVRNKAPTLDVAAFYKTCQMLDEWPGEDYDGTSVRAAAKALQAAGYIGAYLWAFDIKTICDWVIHRGPMIFGTLWLESMFDVDRAGYVVVDRTSEVVGGHSYAIVGADLDRKRLTLANSWDTSWGRNGKAYLRLDDAAMLIAEDGEALCANELLVK